MAAPREAVWALWEDANRWSDWNPAIAHAELQGPFQVGTTAVIRSRRRPAMKFDITALEPGEVFVDETGLPGSSASARRHRRRSATPRHSGS
jgi:hypothetical protein